MGLDRQATEQPVGQISTIGRMEPTGRANARPMTDSVKQSIMRQESVDCFVAALLAMTAEILKASPACVRTACRRTLPASRLFRPRRDWARRTCRKPLRCGYCPASRQWSCAPWFRGSGARPLRASTASTSTRTCHDNPSSLIALTSRLATCLLRKTASEAASLFVRGRLRTSCPA
jgi:hypothetical protein